MTATTAFLHGPLISSTCPCPPTTPLAVAFAVKTPQPVDQRGMIRRGAVNRTISTTALTRAIENSLFQPGGQEEEAAAAAGEQRASYGKSAIGGRWELSFVNHKQLPFPFYLPVRQSMLTFHQEGAKVQVKAAITDYLHIIVTTFTIISTSKVSPEDEGIMEALVVAREDGKRYKLVVSAEDGVTVLAVRSEDGEALLLLHSIEEHMRRIDENKRKHAREIINLARYEAESKKRGDANMAGYRAVREVWRLVFHRVDTALGTQLSKNDDLLNLAPWFPFLVIAGLVAAKSGAYNQGWGGILHP